MTKEREKLVYTYMKGLTRLYGIVEWKQFIKVFNLYNSPKITKTEINDAETLLTRHEKYCVFYTDVVVSALAPEEYIDKAQYYGQGKKYYLPTEAEILERADSDKFYEKTEAHMKLHEYLGTLIRNGSKVGVLTDTGKVMAKVCLMISAEYRNQQIFDYIHKSGVEFKTIKDAEKFAGLLMTAWNDTRMWANKGHTPNELAKTMK